MLTITKYLLVDVKGENWEILNGKPFDSDDEAWEWANHIYVKDEDRLRLHLFPVEVLPAEKDVREIALGLGRIVQANRLMSTSSTWEDLKSKTGAGERTILIHQAEYVLALLDEQKKGKK